MPRAHAVASDHAPTDDALMTRVRAGEVRLLGELFERHQRALLNYFLRASGFAGRAAGEDLVQEVFLRALKYRASYQPGTFFLTWIYTIARNVRLDYLYKRRGEVSWDDALEPSIAPIDGAAADQEHHLLAAALAQLPDDKREILVLSRFQEMKHEHIAALLGCAPGAVKVRVHRALRELRRQYELLTNRGGS